jgi:hypothetical protein
VTERFPRQRRVGIGEIGDLADVVDTVDVLRYPRGGDIPIVVFELIEIDERDGHVPVLAVGRVGYGECVSEIWERELGARAGSGSRELETRG